MTPSPQNRSPLASFREATNGASRGATTPNPPAIGEGV
jgi:hypothetical protein